MPRGVLGLRRPEKNVCPETGNFEISGISCRPMVAIVLLFKFFIKLISQELKEEAARTLVDLCSTYSVNAGDSVDIPCDFVQTANCPEFSHFDGCAKSCDLRSCSDYLAKNTCEDNGYLLGGCVCDNGSCFESSENFQFFNYSPVN